MFQSEKHHKILQWLGGVNHTKIQKYGTKLRGNVKEPTGSWFFDGSPFKSWQERAGERLWVHGIAGAGKSVLRIISALSFETWTNSKGFLRQDCAYIKYCRTSTSSPQHAKWCIGLLLLWLPRRKDTAILEHTWIDYSPDCQPKSEVFTWPRGFLQMPWPCSV